MDASQTKRHVAFDTKKLQSTTPMRSTFSSTQPLLPHASASSSSVIRPSSASLAPSRSSVVPSVATHYLLNDAAHATEVRRSRELQQILSRKVKTRTNELHHRLSGPKPLPHPRPKLVKPFRQPPATTGVERKLQYVTVCHYPESCIASTPTITQSILPMEHASNTSYACNQ